MIFCEDVSNPEGPVSLPDGGWLITEMNRGIISHISADGKEKRAIAKTGRPNGLALDGDGNLWVAESKYPALLKLSMSGEITTISRGLPEIPFLWPNDLCFGPDGAIYMTDLGILLNEMEVIDPPEAAYNLPIDGRVFRIDPETGDCDLLDRGLRFANGIAFGPDGGYLYVNETLTGNIFCYKFLDGQVVGERQFFGNVMTKACTEFGRLAGPDGMAFDADGNIYVGVLQQGDIAALGPDGSVVDRYPLPGNFPTNLAFDLPGRNRILITEGSNNQLLMLGIPQNGLPLYLPEIGK